MNAVSSRSHAILMLRLIDSGQDVSEPTASMFLVDLAGSERLARSGVTGLGAEEAVAINQSLSGLGRVIITLIEGRQGFVPYNASPLTMILKAGLGGNSKTALVACVTQAEDSISESVNTLRFAMQASHVKNKVDKNSASAKADAEKEALVTRMQEMANCLELAIGARETIDLPKTGPIEVIGRWSPGPVEKPVILLGAAVNAQVGTKGDLQELAELVAEVAAAGHPVIAPLLQSTGSSKELDGNVAVLAELMDWLGVVNAVIYGRDWGAIIACKYKIAHPKRVKHIVMEDRGQKVDEKLTLTLTLTLIGGQKVDEKGYKDMMKRDPNAAFNLGYFLWFFDGDFANMTKDPKPNPNSNPNPNPMTKDPKPGKNLTGFKGKVTFLWPFHCNGRHDPTMKRNKWAIHMTNAVAKVLKTTAIDSYLLTESDVAQHIKTAFAATVKPKASGKKL